MELGESIKVIMKKRGYSQSRLAEEAHISQSGISTIISGASSPSAITLKQIANVLNCSVAELMGENVIKFTPMTPNAVPIVGSIACSPLAEPDITPDGYADLPDGVHADFALRCIGDSMEPLFKDGDLVLIRQQPEVENGQIAAVGVEGETTLKHVYKTERGLLLTANNPKYAPIQIKPNEEVVIYGLAVGYVRMF